MKHTTDNQEEIFDLVDNNDQVIGQATRGECHRDKTLIHRSVSILLYNDKGDFFLQKRSRTKDIDPGLWTVSCSGHVDQGQTFNTAAQRELQEELGIKTSLKLLKKHITYLEKETEMNAVYQGYHNGPFTLHPQEIETGKFFSKKELNQKFKSEKIKLTPQAIINLRQILGLLQ